MTENQRIVEQKQKRRYQLLLELWKAVEGKEYTNVHFMQIANSIGFSTEEATEIYHYFTNEAFFSSRRVGWGVSLSHQAIIEIENSLTSPQYSTEHFSSTVIQNFNAPVGVVQTGNNNTANFNQNIGQDLSEILELLAELKIKFQSLPKAEKEEAIEVIDALEIEVQSESPSKGRIKAYLNSMKDFAVKTGTDITSKIVTELIKNQIGIA